jgi:hypothetical protein
MAEKNLLIGFGETLTAEVTPPRGGGGKKHPYTFQQAQKRLIPQVKALSSRIQNVPDEAVPDGKLVACFTLHPAYYGKSYFPENIFDKSGLCNIGSKSTRIKPEISTNSRLPDEQATTTLYMAGSVENFDAFRSILTTGSTQVQQKEIAQFETIEYFEPTQKIKYIDQGRSKHKLEVVLQTGGNIEIISDCFNDYAESRGCVVDFSRSLSSGGLLFLPVEAESDSIEQLAEYTHLRAVREMAELRIQKPSVFRHASLMSAPDLPKDNAIDSNVKVAIFDGGLGINNFDTWCNEITYSALATNADYLAHGQEVTSTVLFGHIQDGQTELPRPYSNIDHYRVIDPTNDQDVDLFDVLHRIKGALTSKKYQFANISLGPRLPIDDDDVHTWTAILDEVISQTGTLVTIAIGNDGEEKPELNRIQPPSDMVNGLAVGAASTCDTGWVRAPYSCVGPGRSPGLVKPDGLAFGGSKSHPIKLLSPLANSVVETAGTSFASPLALRSAIGAYTDIATQVTPLTTKALLIHFADDKNLSRSEVGWGKFPETTEEFIFCDDTEATVVYQGTLNPSKCLRADIPFPDIPMRGNVIIKATFCYFSQLDPEHSGNYTRSGLEVVFRNDANDISKTKSFFKQKDMFETEQEARTDAHKWETTLKNQKSFRATSLNDPCFYISYHTREKSKATSDSPMPPLPYVLVVTVSQPRTAGIYNNILQRYQTLQPIQTRQRISLRGKV